MVLGQSNGIALYAAIAFFLFSFIGQEVTIIQLIIDTLEPLSIILAVLFSSKRSLTEKTIPIQAWSIIDNATGLENSQARIIALEDLCDDGFRWKKSTCQKPNSMGLK